MPVLLRLPFRTYSTRNFHYKVEEYVTEVIEGSSGTKSLLNLNHEYDRKSKRRNNVYDAVYVESFDPVQVKAAYTYVTFIVFDVKKSFKPYSKEEICNKLVDSDVACISKVDCYILRSAGIECPDVFELNINQSKTIQNETKAGHKIKPWVFILISALLFLVVIALLLFFYKKRKRSFGKCESLVDNDENYVEPLVTGTPEPIYESISNIADENNYVDMNMESSKYDVPKNNTGKKEIDLFVDILGKEPRYTTPPTPA